LSDSHDNRAKRRHEQQFRKLIKKLTDRHGADRCHGCGRMLESGEPTVTSYNASGRFMTAAGCCHHEIMTAIAVGVYFDAKDTPAEWLRHAEPRGRA
jgi:hypothetical protein